MSNDLNSTYLSTETASIDNSTNATSDNSTAGDEETSEEDDSDHDRLSSKRKLIIVFSVIGFFVLVFIGFTIFKSIKKCLRFYYS